LPIRARAFTALAAVAALTVPVSIGSAAEVSGICDGQSFTTPFAAWGDSASYTLIPGGDFEGTLEGWQASKKAKIVTDRVDNLGTGTDAAALALPAKSSVTSPPVCVTTDYPFMRFFARSTDGASGSRLTVEVLYDNGGPVTTVKVADLPASSTSWILTPRLRTGVYLATLGATIGAVTTTGELTSSGDLVGAGDMRVRLTANGGSWEIDDMYVDPKMR